MPRTMSGYSKAIAAGVSAAAATLVFVYPDGITAAEYGEIAGSFVTALLVTYTAPRNNYGDNNADS